MDHISFTNIDTNRIIAHDDGHHNGDLINAPTMIMTIGYSSTLVSSFIRSSPIPPARTIRFRIRSYPSGS